MTAAEVAARRAASRSSVIVEKFGLRGKHIAAADEHVSDLSVRGRRALLEETDLDPSRSTCVMYFGSMWKDYAVWQAAPWIAHRLGCTNALAVEFDNVSYGTPVALRLAHDFLLAEPELRTVLAVAASRESYLLDYANERSRFMFNFGDGAVAACSRATPAATRCSARTAITDGSLSLQVKVPSGGSVEPERRLPLPRRRRSRRDEGAARRRQPRRTSSPRPRARSSASGATLADVAYLCGIHMKRSMHDAHRSARSASTRRAPPTSTTRAT